MWPSVITKALNKKEAGGSESEKEIKGWKQRSESLKDTMLLALKMVKGP